MTEPVRLINTKAHALTDYGLGLVLLCSPFIFGFSWRSAAYYSAASAGLVSVCLALFTAYEYAAVKLIPLRVHLYADIVCGAALASSPWLLSFVHLVYKPHLVFGLAQMIVAILTDRLLYNNVKGIT